VRVPLGPGGAAPRTFARTSVSLPLQSTGKPLRISLRASANVPGVLIVHLGGSHVGDIHVGSGEPDLYLLDVPAPAPGQRLDLAFALSPRFPADSMPTAEPLLVAERLEIASSRGLVLRPHARLLVACWPLAAVAVIWLLRLGSRAGLAAAILSAAMAALAAHAAPIQFSRIGPYLIVAITIIGLVPRLPISAAREKEGAEGAARAWAWAAGLAAIPAIEISILLAAFFGRTLLDHVPGIVNDAIDYWLEARAFAVAGFHGGYFTIDERTARASFSHFGSHGPFFPMLLGTLGRLLGWHPWSIPVLHLAMLTVALWIFARCVLPGRGRALTALSLATFWPLFLFLPTSLQEGFHLTAAVLLAAALRPILDGRAPSAFGRAWLLALLVVAVLLRPSWGLLLPPAFALLSGATSWRRRALAAGWGLATWVTLVAAFSYTKAPFGREEFLFLKAARLQTGASALIAHTAMNARRFVDSGSALEIWSRFLVLTLAVASGILAVRRRPRRELAFHAWNLGSLLLATSLTYVFGPWADYRVLGAHLLLSQVLLMTSRAETARRLGVLALLAQVASVGPFFEAFPRLGESYRYDAGRIEAFGAAARGVVRFDASRDAWCNTLLTVNPPYFYPEMVDLTAGVGVTMVFGWEGAPRPAFRSLYVLLDPDDPRRWSLGAPTVTQVGPEHVRVTRGSWLSLNLKPLAATPVGTLYRNLDARCPGG
jgi:hypothetical protein